VPVSSIQAPRKVVTTSSSAATERAGDLSANMSCSVVAALIAEVGAGGRVIVISLLRLEVTLGQR